MPRNVRNFWVTINVDGRKSEVATGPRARDGCIDMDIKIRDNGDVRNAGSIGGRCSQDGTLTLFWRPADGSPIVDLITTKR